MVPVGQQLNMNQNPFALFINSLFPWVNVPGAREEVHDPDMPYIEEDDWFKIYLLTLVNYNWWEKY